MLEPRPEEGTGDSQRVRQARVATDKVVEQLATLAVVGAYVVRLDVLFAVTAHHKADTPLVPVNVGGLVSTSKGGLVAGIAEHYRYCPVVGQRRRSATSVRTRTGVSPR